MMAMEQLGQQGSSLDTVKPRTPRFEAYVMTGDAILNLSRTTHSPEFFPIHSRKKKRLSQATNSVPNSPCELEHEEKPWESEKKSDCTQSEQCSTTILMRNSRSEDTLSTPSTQNEIKPEDDEEMTFSYNTLLETGKDSERIVWTYNAPHTEQELRRMESEQFWLNSAQKVTSKQSNHLTNIKEVQENRLESKAASEDSSEKSENIAREIEDSSQPVIMNFCTLKTDVQSAKEVDEAEGEMATLVEEDCVSPRTKLTSSGYSTSMDEDSDADSLQSFHYSPKGVDMPSAIRLAKRLVQTSVKMRSYLIFLVISLQVIRIGWISEV